MRRWRLPEDDALLLRGGLGLLESSVSNGINMAEERRTARAKERRKDGGVRERSPTVGCSAAPGPGRSASARLSRCEEA